MDVAVKDAVDVLNKLMKIRKITGEICNTTRPLWEEVFYEDSAQFTDYYFGHKAEKNIGYVIGQNPYDAMMFRTPYVLKIGEEQREISYIVGVATRKECRHRGYMRQLLMHSFREMYREKNPFTFLMPANPAIYEPFDFKYVYERDVWEFKEAESVIEILEAITSCEKEDYSNEKNFIIKAVIKKENVSDEDNLELKATEYGVLKQLQGLYSVRNLRKHFPQFPIIEFLAEFANQYLKEHYNIYVHRDISYYEMQLKESEAQNGDIYVLFEQGHIKAFFLYAKEGEEIFLQEVMEETEGILDFLQKAEKKKPIIMARIIHLEEMMKLVCSKEKRTMMLAIEDELIPENTGIFRWELTPKGSKVTRITPDVGEWENCADMKAAEMQGYASMHIRDFAPMVLTGVFLNEIV